MPAALLGPALSAISVTLAEAGHAIGAQRSARSAAKDAIEDLATLAIEELAALVELPDAAAPRVSIHHGSLLAAV